MNHEQSDVSKTFRVAVNLQRSGQRERCLRLIDSLLKEHPRHARAWVLKSMTETSPISALSAAEKAYSLRPDLECAQRALASALTRCDAQEAKDKKRSSLDKLKKAADLCPHDAQAFFRLGRAARQLRRFDEAGKAFERTIALDPQNERAHFWLAAISGGSIIETHEDSPQIIVRKAPTAHLKALYDDYAERYDFHLGTTLASQAPDLVAEALKYALSIQEKIYKAPPPKAAATTGITLDGLDMGSGTGLSGKALIKALAPRPVQWRGVDLSPNMCKRASQRKIYRNVRAMDLLSALLLDPGYDLLVSTDVIVYFGDLDPFFSATAANVRKRPQSKDQSINCVPPMLALSLEDLDERQKATTTPASNLGWFLTHTGRFLHAPSYVKAVAKNYDWHLIHEVSAELRKQAGEPVLGHIYVFVFLPHLSSPPTSSILEQDQQSEHIVTESEESSTRNSTTRPLSISTTAGEESPSSSDEEHLINPAANQATHNLDGDGDGEEGDGEDETADDVEKQRKDIILSIISDDDDVDIAQEAALFCFSRAPSFAGENQEGNDNE